MKVSNKITSAFASNKYVMNDVVSKGGIITATDRMLKIKKKFLRLPVRWDDRSETWFKMFCI